MVRMTCMVRTQVAERCGADGADVAVLEIEQRVNVVWVRLPQPAGGRLSNDATRIYSPHMKCAGLFFGGGWSRRHC